MRTAPYGAWASPVRPEDLAERPAPYAPDPVEEGVYWLQQRPDEGGRTVLVWCARGGEPEDVTPEGFNVRTRVHEYGGGEYWRDGETLFFSHFADGRVYRQDARGGADAVTPEPGSPNSLRYADGRVLPGGWVVCVRESHEAPEVLNDLVVFPADGSLPPRPLREGRDFYASPRPSPDGKRLCWLTWNHPQLPFTGTELWVADLVDGELENAEHVAGGPGRGDRPAGVGPGRAPALGLRPHGLVEPLPRGREPDPDRSRARLAGLGVRDVALRLSRRRPDRVRGHAQVVRLARAARPGLTHARAGRPAVHVVLAVPAHPRRQGRRARRRRDGARGAVRVRRRHGGEARVRGAPVAASARRGLGAGPARGPDRRRPGARVPLPAAQPRVRGARRRAAAAHGQRPRRPDVRDGAGALCRTQFWTSRGIAASTSTTAAAPATGGAIANGSTGAGGRRRRGRVAVARFLADEGEADGSRM